MGKTQSRQNSFVKDARKMGLDTDEANADFERAFGKIAPPKKKGDVAGNREEKAPSTND